MLSEERPPSEDAPIMREEARSPQSSFTRMTILIGLVIVALLILTVLLAVTLTKHRSSDSLATLVQVDAIFARLTELSRIAYTYSNGTRAVGTIGFNMTGEYIFSQLIEAGYAPKYQYFNVPVWASAGVAKGKVFIFTATPTLSMTDPIDYDYIFNTDFVVQSCSPSGTVISVAAQLIPDYGCDPSNYTGFIPGNIALLRRGICTTIDKVANATAFHPSAIIIYENNTASSVPFRSRVDCTLFNINTAPVFGATASLGAFWNRLDAQGLPINMSLSAEGVINTVVAFNIIAETEEGNPNRTIVLGSHCDSVPAGPGMNDNGSGTSTLLETAVQLKKHSKVSVKSKVRFCWWGAEELGLLGSKYYVSQLTPAEISQIAMNLNFDMLGSPNYFRGVYNASSTIYPAVLNGSLTLQYLLEDSLSSVGQAFNMTPMDGRSDYVYFNAVGIPSTGFFTGAEVLKTQQFRDLYGGLANAAYDPCYHQPCDNLDNINKEILGQSARLIASTLQTLAENPNLVDYVATNSPPRRW